MGSPPFMSLVSDAGRFLDAIKNKDIERIPEGYSDDFADFVYQTMKRDKR